MDWPSAGTFLNLDWPKP